MADEADITAERDEREAPVRLAASRKHQGLPPIGYCHWCDEPVADTLRFCDSDCKADHERAQRGRGLVA